MPEHTVDEQEERLRREIAQLQGLLEQKIQSLHDIVFSRLDAMDKALELANRQGTLVDIARQFEIMVERLSRLEKDKARLGGID